MDPGFEKKVRDSFAQQGLMQHLGARMVSIAPGQCEIRLGYREQLTQQHGYFHAGATSAIADSACGYAAYSLMPEGASVLTVEFKINLLAPAEGEELVARGRVVRSGRTLKVCEADVFALKQGEETHCALMLATVMGLPGRTG